MFCSKCGTEHSEDSQFCQKCGQALIVPSTASARPPQPEPKHSSRFRRTPLFLLLVLITLVIFYYAGGHESPTEKEKYYYQHSMMRLGAVRRDQLAVNLCCFAFFRAPHWRRLNRENITCNITCRSFELRLRANIDSNRARCKQACLQGCSSVESIVEQKGGNDPVRRWHVRKDSLEFASYGWNCRTRRRSTGHIGLHWNDHNA